MRGDVWLLAVEMLKSLACKLHSLTWLTLMDMLPLTCPSQARMSWHGMQAAQAPPPPGGARHACRSRNPM